MASVEQIERDLNGFWALFGASYVFFMQTGFAMLEAGCVRAKNTKNILIKNVLDACMAAISWWFVGWAFAYGTDGRHPNAFIGGTDFFSANKGWGDKGTAPTDSNAGNYWGNWLFQWAFSATASTIVSGAVAERCQFRAYLVYTTFMCGFVYPVVAHWGWSSEGFLSSEKPDPTLGANGMIDFAGSAVVHLTGGTAALMGALFLGPRIGKFDREGNPLELPGHSSVLAALGTLILWFGWYGFNSVSTLQFVGSMGVAQKVSVTTTLSAAFGGLTCLVIHTSLLHKPMDVGPILNGILAGLVAVTAGCSVIEPWAAAIIGTIGASLYYGASWLLQHKLRIDDPVDAAPVHLVNGTWGTLAAGLFATKYNTVTVYGTSPRDYGLLLGGGGRQFGVQVAGVAIIAAWSLTTMSACFMLLKRFDWLRVSAEVEISGMDKSKHGGDAYPDFSFIAGSSKGGSGNLSRQGSMDRLMLLTGDGLDKKHATTIRPGLPVAVMSVQEDPNAVSPFVGGANKEAWGKLGYTRPACNTPVYSDVFVDK
eukprot:jgi/Mesvir1/23273/Mv20979-RA.1